MMYLKTYVIMIVGLVLWLNCEAQIPAVSMTSMNHPGIDDNYVLAEMLNSVGGNNQGLVLTNPRYIAEFTKNSVKFSPSSNAPEFIWSLSGGAPVLPVLDNNKVVYQRGNISEEYLLKANTIEQQFIVHDPSVAKHGIVIAGKVMCDGKFSETHDGWTWKNGFGEVTLSDVFVFDANKTRLPAQMTVTENSTTIEVSAEHLEGAVFPITIDPEIGTNDYRISTFGTDGDIGFQAKNASISYSSTTNKYLVVWEGNIGGENEIYGQLLNGTTGEPEGSEIMISNMGPSGNTAYDATNPDVASSGDEFFVVWQADDNTNPLIDNEFEIYGQRINGSSGALISSRVRISDMGTDGDANYGAFSPAITYNSIGNGGNPEYFVVWSGDDNTGSLADNEFEIYGQRLSLTGDESGFSNDVRLSDLGVDGFDLWQAFAPDVAWNSTSNQYLVTWYGDDNIFPLAVDENEIFIQRLTSTGASTGSNDIRVSFAGPNGDTNYSSVNPAIAYNSVDNNYLVVWYGDDDTAPLVDNENEIHGTIISNIGAIGTSLRISDMGPDGNANYDALNPAVAHDPFLNQFLVNWKGDDNSSTLVDNEFEIFVQLVTGIGAESGIDTRLSDVGGTGNITYNAFRPAIVYNSTMREFINNWYADENIGSLANNEYEIWGQRFAEMDVEPTAQASSFSPSTITQSSFTVSFSAAAGTPDSYIALRKSGSSPTDIPIDQQGYSIGDPIDASTVAYVGSALTFDESGLSANTAYYYDIFSFNGVNSSANYLTTARLEGNVNTLYAEPSTQATAISFSNLGTNSISVDFVGGNGTSSLLVGRAGSAVNNFPQDGSGYTANTVFGLGSNLGSSNFVLAAGSGPLTITGLAVATEYYFRVFEFNGSSSLANYNVSAATGNPSSIFTLSPQPANQPTALNLDNFTVNSMTGSFTAATSSPGGYIVLRKAGSAPTGTPVDGTVYTAGNTIVDATVVSTGSSTTFNSTGLSSDTDYYYKIYSYNGSGTTVNFLTASPLGGNATTLATEPSAQPTLLTFNTVTSSSMTGAFIAASGTPDGYIAFRKSGLSPTDVPVDGTVYSVGDPIGTGSVAYVGSSFTFDDAGLSANTTYYYDIFSFNGVNASTNYRTAPPLEGNATTLTSEPTLQTLNISFSALGTNAITIDFTDGDGDSRLVVAKKLSAVNSFPIDGNSYIANTVFGSGSNLGSSNFVVGAGSGPFTITGLSTATTYHFRVFEFNGSGGLENYNGATATDNPSFISTLATEPTAQPSAFAFDNITDISMAGSFSTATGNPDGYIVLRKAGSAPTGSPVDGKVYSAGDPIGDGTVVFTGSNTTFNSTGLSPEMFYYYKVFSYNGSGITVNFLTASPLEGNATTLATQPSAQPTLLTFNTITSTSMSGSFIATTGSPDGYIALRKSGSSPTDVPVDGIVYSVGDPIGTSTVAYAGSSLTFDEVSLLANTTYHYDIISYNGVNAATNYRTVSPLEGSATTLASAPATQARDISFSALATNAITIDYTNGNGVSRIVVAREGLAVNNFPQDGNGYTANIVFGSGSDLGSSNFVVGAGNGPFTITGLSVAIEYYFRIFEFNGSGSLTNYNVSTATGNPSSVFTLSLQPASQPTVLTLDNFTVNSMTGSFTAASGSPDGYIVLRKAGSAPTSVPVDGTIYSAGNIIGDGTVVSTGISISFNSTGLSPDTDYYYKIYSYNGSGTTVNFLTASPLGGNATTLATEPSAQPTLLTFNTITPTSMSGSFTAATGSPDGYIVLRMSGSSPTDVPDDGTAYSFGDPIGTSTVAYVGSLLTFDEVSLSANTTYFYDIFSFNGVNASSNYRTVSPLEGNRTTLTSEPATQATAIIFSSLETNRVTIDFTDGNGTSRLVVAKAGSAVDNFPVDGNSYVANPAFGSGSDLGSFNYVVGEGSGPFTITGLSIAVEYHFFVVEFNGTGGLGNYNIATATGNPSSISTLATAPTAQPTALTFNSITDAAINGSFVAATGNPTGYIVLGKAGSAPTGTPVNGTIYSAGDAVGDATVVFTGSNTTFVNTGLSPETVYHYAVFSYNGSGAAVIFLTGSPLEGNATTLATESSAQPSLLSFSAVTSTSMTGSYTAATGAPNGYIVLRKSGSSPTDLPMDGTAYSSGNTIGTSTVAFVGNALTFNETNLSANTTYYYDIFSYNGANTATNYLVAAPLEGNRTTLASEPATQGFDIVFSGLETNEITLGFTDGDGTSRLVVAKEGSAVDNFPVDGITYTANSIFGSGSDLGSSSFVVGTGSGPFTITGLSGATQYHFNIFEFNGSAGLENYNVAAATGNPSVISTLALEPASQPTELTFSDITTSSMTGSFTAAADNPAGYLVLRKEGSAPTETPSDGISYAINDNIGTSLVIYVGNDISFPSSGLNAGTVYHYAVFSSNGTGATLNYFVSGPLENSVITISPAPEVLDPTQIAPTSFTAPWNASAGATHYVLDVSADDFSTFVPGYDGKEVTTGLEEAVTGLNPNTTYKYRVRAVNLSGVSANSLDKSVTTLEESSASPLQISTPVVKKNENGYTISVSLSSGSGTHVVSFYSRGIIDQNFIESELTSTTDTYEATVLDTELDELGLEFYFTATDDLTTTPLTSAGFIYREIVVNQTSISGLSSGGMKENYRMVSIPYTLEDNLVQSIFGVLGEYDNSKWRLIRYQNGKNVDFPAFNRIVNGQGYWFNSLEPVEIKMGAGTVPNYNQQNPFTLTLTKGWNQVGAPYPFDINWSDVQDANPGATISSLKVYQPTSLSFTENDNLKVWSGGFVFADNSVQISFPVTLKTSAGSRKTGKIANVIESGLLDDKEWFVPLRLTHGKAENSMIGFGMHPDASESKDKYDDITLPRFFNYLEMNSEHSEFFAPLFTKDVVPAATQYRWKFVMQSNFEGETASLEWDPDRFGNNNSMLLLYDASEQRFINMKSNSNYEFDFRNSKQFEFIYSFDRESWQSDFTLLGLPYPNPVMETVNIPLIVKDQEEVSVEILDIMGRGVKNLFKGTPSGGTQTITWDRTNESNVRVGPGVYLVNLVSGRYRQVKKIIVK